MTAAASPKDDLASSRQDARLDDPSVDPDEIEKFSAIAAEWWDPDGKFAPLHRFNPVRLTFLRETVCEAFGRESAGRRPFEGLKLLDVGCGGGLVSEPMARLGADVTGLDASAKNIKTASVHAEEAGLDIAYRAGTAEQALADDLGPFDVVLALEIVEHVADVDAFLQTCARLVAPGGLFVMATLNRTSKAFALAIVGAEYVLGWLPRGTHDWRKFVRPSEAARALATAGLEVGDPIGVSYTPVLDRWRITDDASVNYMLTARRPVGASASRRGGN